MHSSGQSGNPFPAQYGSLNTAWAQVDYLSMSMRRADIEQPQPGTLRLLPSATP